MLCCAEVFVPLKGEHPICPAVFEPRVSLRRVIIRLGSRLVVNVKADGGGGLRVAIQPVDGSGSDDGDQLT